MKKIILGLTIIFSLVMISLPSIVDARVISSDYECLENSFVIEGVVCDENVLDGFLVKNNDLITCYLSVLPNDNFVFNNTNLFLYLDTYKEGQLQSHGYEMITETEWSKGKTQIITKRFALAPDGEWSVYFKLRCSRCDFYRSDDECNKTISHMQKEMTVVSNFAYNQYKSLRNYNSDMVWITLLSAIIAIIAVFGNVFQERFRKYWNKPNFKFRHEETTPFRKENVIIANSAIPGNPPITGTFERFSVENTGRGHAINCRCQIYRISEGEKQLEDYKGLPLKWASRPEAVLDPLKGERLNIGQGETEFVDLVVTSDNDKNIHFECYHTVPIGIPREIKPSTYEICVIFSGDNFEPRILTFNVSKQDSSDKNDLKVKLVRVSKSKKPK